MAYERLAGYQGRAHGFRRLEGEDAENKSFVWYATEDMLGDDPEAVAYRLRALIDQPKGTTFEAEGLEDAPTRVLITNVEVSDQDHEVASGIKTVSARLTWLEP